MGRTRLDLFAVAASLLTLAMVAVYFVVIGQQGNDPAVWAVAALLVAAAAAGYGAVPAFPLRRVALLLAGLVLVAMGLLAIFSIGLPVLLAGVLCFIAFARHRGNQPAGDSQTGGTGAS